MNLGIRYKKILNKKKHMGYLYTDSYLSYLKINKLN